MSDNVLMGTWAILDLYIIRQQHSREQTEFPGLATGLTISIFRVLELSLLQRAPMRAHRAAPLVPYRHIILLFSAITMMR